MKHLSLDERIALIEAAEAPSHPHVAACAACRADVASARFALAEARGVEAPEPSPLFWEHFSRRISERLAADPAPAKTWRPGWRVAVPLAVGVAALVVAVAVDRGTAPRPDAAPPAAAIGSDSQATTPDETNWLVLSRMAGEFDVQTLSDSLGKPSHSAVESAVWQLSERERAELAALLEAEMQRASSGS